MNSKEEKDREFEESMKKCEKAIRELSKEQRAKLLQYLLDRDMVPGHTVLIEVMP